MATLILADDSYSMARTVEQALSGEDVRVDAALSGERALSVIEADPPAIVLADIGMARVNGYDIASYMKKSPALAHIPVLLLAGPFDRIDAEKARATGCNGILVKPIEPYLLAELVRGLLAGRRVDSSLLWPASAPRPESINESIPELVPASINDASHASSHDAWDAPVVERRAADAPSAAQFDAGLDQLDAAFASTGAPVAVLNPNAAAEFASDLSVLRGKFETSPRRRKTDRMPAAASHAAAPVLASPAVAPSAWLPHAPQEAKAPERPIRIKMKIGAMEFEAEGPAELVQSQLDEFKRLAGAAPAPTPLVRSIAQHTAGRRRRAAGSPELASS
jgi:CheY-like chemotaxis protein